MTNGTIINHIITDTIEAKCKDPEVKELLISAMKYEIDIYNRSLRREDIEGQINIMIEGILRRHR